MVRSACASRSHSMGAWWRKIAGMKLAESNPFLRSPHRDANLLSSIQSSSAIEGIRKPFENGARDVQVSNMREFIDFWKQRASSYSR
jgi:hypothetical protein